MRQPLRTVFAALFVVLAASNPATADMSFPFPSAYYTYPTHRITTEETFPNHVFVVFRPKQAYVQNQKNGIVQKEVYRPASQAEYVELTPTHPIIVPIDRNTVDVVFLLVVSRDVAARYRTALELAEAIEAGRVESFLRRELPRREKVPGTYENSEFTIDYRMQRRAGGIELVRTTEAVERKWYEEWCCVVPVLLPLAMFLGGFLLIRRRRRNRPVARPVRTTVEESSPPKADAERS
jgi:hypothetical protein